MKTEDALLQFAAATKNELYDPDWDGGDSPGQQRRALSVIDFGDVRYAIDCDLTYF